MRQSCTYITHIHTEYILYQSNKADNLMNQTRARKGSRPQVDQIEED